VRAAREVYAAVPADVVRVAALVEISAAAAALARTVAKFRHLDLEQVAPYVSDRVDLWAVLGRGRWLPTMTRHVPAPPAGRVDLAALAPVRPAVRRRLVRRGPASPGQGALLAAAAAGEG
jgi:hypothetical protein